jgi:uroporphyrinogen-III synthase
MNPSVDPGALSGRRIVITRPAGQNERLAHLIRSAGGAPIVFPTIEIVDIEDLAPLITAVDHLDAYDLAVFVSPNAVDKAMSFIHARRAWPGALRVATVGRAGVRALARYGVTDALAPADRFDSEALLECPELARMGGKRVVIFRGEDGRELLGHTLRERGARVDYVACYRRARPAGDIQPLLRAWGEGAIDAVTVSSSEGLRNLFTMLGKRGQQRLKDTPVFAPHARIAANARALGCERVTETAPADEGIVAGLVAFWAKIE